MTGLRVERDEAVLRITLARPERRNAFDAALIAELTEAFANVGDARAVVLSGEGPSFCAGADVEWQRSSIDLSYEENVEDALRLYRMLEGIDSCPAPVVCRVHGFALGGGSGLVACADHFSLRERDRSATGTPGDSSRPAGGCGTSPASRSPTRAALRCRSGSVSGSGTALRPRR